MERHIGRDGEKILDPVSDPDLRALNPDADGDRHNT